MITFISAGAANTLFFYVGMFVTASWALPNDESIKHNLVVGNPVQMVVSQLKGTIQSFASCFTASDLCWCAASYTHTLVV